MILFIIIWAHVRDHARSGVSFSVGFSLTLCALQIYIGGDQDCFWSVHY